MPWKYPNKRLVKLQPDIHPGSEKNTNTYSYIMMVHNYLYSYRDLHYIEDLFFEKNIEVWYYNLVDINQKVQMSEDSLDHYEHKISRSEESLRWLIISPHLG